MGRNEDEFSVMWTQQKIDQFIADGVEESQTLDYKASGALDKHPDKKLEIQRDVSAFANAAGGVIIYGVREHGTADKKHLPERLDPISRKSFSKEWLEQVISGIQPRIRGVVIHPVPLASSDDDCCYVVEIPESETAHQVSDGRYYRRYNFERRHMQDFEIRDTMNRSRHPVIEVMVRLSLLQRWEGNSCFLVRLRNISKRLAKHFKCVIKLPLYANGIALSPDEPCVLKTNEDGISHFEFSLPQGLKQFPLFPGAEETLKKELTFGGGWQSKTGAPLSSAQSIHEVVVIVYADEMNPVERSIPLSTTLHDWS